MLNLFQLCMHIFCLNEYPYRHCSQSAKWAHSTTRLGKNYVDLSVCMVSCINSNAYYIDFVRSIIHKLFNFTSCPYLIHKTIDIYFPITYHCGSLKLIHGTSIFYNADKNFYTPISIF